MKPVTFFCVMVITVLFSDCNELRRTSMLRRKANRRVASQTAVARGDGSHARLVHCINPPKCATALGCVTR